MALIGWLGVLIKGTMNPRRTIQITRKNDAGEIGQTEVKLLYCAASETGFQTLSGVTMEVFAPELEKNEEGKWIMKAPPKATDMNYIQLSLACIMRNEWMQVPSTIKPEMEEREGKGKRKNVKTPTRPSKS